jgi:predicted  nucleic acid-binding Zn ribbon protein
MHTFELRFTQTSGRKGAKLSDAVNGVLGALRMNGQVLGSEFPSAETSKCFTVYVSVPEKSALARKYCNNYVRDSLKKVRKCGFEFSFIDLGPDPESAKLCRCRERTWMLLFTNYVSIESPLRCGGCFGTVPLYWVRRGNDQEFYDVKCWQGDYQACDTLQMHCSTGERSAMAQMAAHDSSLSMCGRSICDQLCKLTKTPVYYYLYRGSDRTTQSGKNRRCPSCGSSWLMQESLFKIFDMKCDKCRLLSNIGWNVRR